MENNVHYEKFKSMNEMLEIMENRGINSVFQKKTSYHHKIMKLRTRENFRAWIPIPMQWN